MWALDFQVIIFYDTPFEKDDIKMAVYHNRKKLTLDANSQKQISHSLQASVSRVIIVVCCNFTFLASRIFSTEVFRVVKLNSALKMWQSSWTRTRPDLTGNGEQIYYGSGFSSQRGEMFSSAPSIQLTVVWLPSQNTATTIRKNQTWLWNKVERGNKLSVWVQPR